MSLDSLNDLLSWLDKVQGLSAAALVFLSCIVIGYVLRFVPKFPNDGIPVVVILWGAVVMLIIADPRASSMPARVWTVRNLLVGLFIGFAAWMSHWIVLSRIEEYISNRFSLGNTQFFSKQKTSLTQESGGNSVQQDAETPKNTPNQ